MMFNLLYLFALVAASPWLLWRCLRTGRYRRDLWPKLSGRIDFKPSSQFTVWFHGVSVGEIHLLRTLVEAYRKRHSNHRLIVSSTTDTGLAEAKKHFENVMPWPFDFSWAVAAALDRIRPNLVVLAEGEMWPNFLAAAKRRMIPVVVVNARMSPRSFSRYRRIAGLAKRLMFDKVSAIAAQDADYASRLRSLGATNVNVTGSIKYDGAANWSGISTLSRLLPVRDSILWVAGSTHAPEEAIVLECFSRLRTRWLQLHLLIVPRHPDRFEEVHRLIAATGLESRRRSTIDSPLEEMPAVILLDTVGELAAAWNLASVGYVGGTLDGSRGGQSMIEPAGHGVPTVFGPHVWNFADAARRLVAAGGAVMVPSAEELLPAIEAILADDALRQQMSNRAREWVRASAGATERTLDVLDTFIETASTSAAA